MAHSRKWRATAASRLACAHTVFSAVVRQTFDTAVVHSGRWTICTHARREGMWTGALNAPHYAPLCYHTCLCCSSPRTLSRRLVTPTYTSMDVPSPRHSF